MTAIHRGPRCGSGSVHFGQVIAVLALTLFERIQLWRGVSGATPAVRSSPRPCRPTTRARPASHGNVTGTVFAVDIVWLLPLSAMAARFLNLRQRGSHRGAGRRPQYSRSSSGQVSGTQFREGIA